MRKRNSLFLKMQKTETPETENAAGHLLSHKNLKLTPIRLEVLSYLLTSLTAVSKSKIEDHFDAYDRITIYRTIKSLVEKEVIHRIIGMDGEVKFAVNNDPVMVPNKTNNSHVHFHCLKCEATFCMAIKIPKIEVPENFQMINSNYSIEGICKNCPK